MTTPIRSATASPLLFPHFQSWIEQFQHPTPRFSALWERFNARLKSDEEFRKNNLYLSALLGESWALQEAHDLVFALGESYGRRGSEDGAIEHHTWCTAPHVLRLSAFHNWLDRHGMWSAQETETIGKGALNFCYEHAVAVLRTRVPAGDNQSLSMALTCAVVGTAFKHVPSLAQRASDLEAFGAHRARLCFQYFPEDGYSGEGATYQSHVVSPLVMWASAYFEQTEFGLGAECQAACSGQALQKILGTETLMTSPGALQWPLDHYGWQLETNLAAKSTLARLSGDWHHLAHAEAIWDRFDFVAWSSDDRMWTLIHWPEGNAPEFSEDELSGWSLPRVGAALDHRGQKSRALLVWDESSAVTQAITRVQVNPNHIVYDRAGEPLFADGASSSPGFLPVGAADAAVTLPPEAKSLLELQYGNLDNWFRGAEIGLLGASNTLFPAGQEGYFPYGGARGHLFWEERTATKSTVTAECLEYFPPNWGLTRARRTISMDESGIVWIVDDYRAQTEIPWAWQCYLRTEAELDLNSVALHVPTAPTVLVWEAGATAHLTDVPNFPGRGDGKCLCWPNEGSRRLYLDLGPRSAVQWAVCILPFDATGASVEKLGEWNWRVRWAGGESSFTLPPGALATSGLANPMDQHVTINDLDDTPFYVYPESEISTADLLEKLANADKDDWRLLTRGFQTLAARNVPEGLPIALELMEQSGHHYQSRSVAGWYLARFAYAPAEPLLRKLLHTPETNLSHRARWGLERLTAAAPC